MNLFRRRPVKVIVEHRGIATLCLALERIAAAMERAHPMLPPEAPHVDPPKSASDVAFDFWLGSKPFVETQRRHYQAIWKIATGKMRCPADRTLSALIEELKEAGAPLPGIG